MKFSVAARRAQREPGGMKFTPTPLGESPALTPVAPPRPALCKRVVPASPGPYLRGGRAPLPLPHCRLRFPVPGREGETLRQKGGET